MKNPHNNDVHMVDIDEVISPHKDVHMDDLEVKDQEEQVMEVEMETRNLVEVDALQKKSVDQVVQKVNPFESMMQKASSSFNSHKKVGKSNRIRTHRIHKGTQDIRKFLSNRNSKELSNSQEDKM